MISESADARLRRLLGGSELEGLRRRLRARYERGDTVDVFTLSGLTLSERRALESLLGRSARSASSMRLKRSELDAVIARAGVAADLRAALEALDGPLTDRKARRMELEREWSTVLGGVDERRLRSLLSATPGVALLKRLAGGDPVRGMTLLERARLVLARIPARGIPLSRLAAETLGDSHALDAGQPVAALVLRACRGDEPGRATGDASFTDIDSRRDQWARVGVSVNELAAPVLCLNLQARDTTSVAKLTAIAATQGEPVHLSLRALLRCAPTWNVDIVYVCENASVVAIAADRLGADCAPLVCTDGMPAAAQQALLGQLQDCGAQLHYHGDFDWPGLTIGNFVLRRFRAAPWRFGADDYRAATADVVLSLSEDSRVEADWDDELAPALAQRGIVVHEEAVVETLLLDLERR